MKLFVKFLMFCLVAAFVGMFAVKTPDGKPLMSLEKLIGKQAGSQVKAIVNDPSAEGVTNALSGNSDVIYKWKDKNGVWQFSQSRPPSTETQTVTYNYKQNIIESPKSADVAMTEEEPAPKKRKLIIPSSAKNAPKSTGLAGGAQSTNGTTSDNPALEMLESGELGGAGLTTVPLDKIPALIQQAKSLNGSMGNRTNQIDAQVNGR